MIRKYYEFITCLLIVTLLISCVDFEDIKPYSEYYLSVDKLEYSFTEIVEPHTDEWGLDYQFQTLDQLSIDDDKNYKVAFDLMMMTKYVPLTEKEASNIFKPIDNNGIANQIIDSANIVFQIVISPIYFGKIAEGDYYCANVIIENDIAYIAVYRNLKNKNYITIYQAVNSEPVIYLSQQIDKLCQNSVNMVE